MLQTLATTLLPRCDVKRYGSKTTALELAIDRLHQSEFGSDSERQLRQALDVDEHATIEYLLEVALRHLTADQPPDQAL